MLLVANGALPKMQKKILLLGVLFLLVIPLIHSGILIKAKTTQQVIVPIFTQTNVVYKIDNIYPIEKYNDTCFKTLIANKSKIAESISLSAEDITMLDKGKLPYYNKGMKLEVDYTKENIICHDKVAGEYRWGFNSSIVVVFTSAIGVFNNTLFLSNFNSVVLDHYFIGIDDDEILRDTYVRDASPTSGAGALPAFAVGNVDPVGQNNATSHLMYDLSAIPLNSYSNYSEICLYVDAGGNAYEDGDNEIVFLYGLNNYTWLEDITFNTKPPGIGALLDSNDSLQDSDELWVCFNGTDWVNDRLENRDSNISFVLNATSDYGERDNVAFTSKEYPLDDSLIHYLYISANGSSIGTWISPVFNLTANGTVMSWDNTTWDSDEPAGTNLSHQGRCRTINYSELGGDNLIIHYMFDSNEGELRNRVNDSFHGTINSPSKLTWYSDSDVLGDNLGGYARFDGVDDDNEYISIQDNLEQYINGSPSMTMGAWIMIHNDGHVPSSAVILDGIDGLSPIFSLRDNGDNYGLLGFIYLNGTSTSISASYNQKLFYNDTWIFVVFDYNVTDFCVYANDTLYACDTGMDYGWVAAGPGTPAGPMTLGNGNGYRNYFGGSMNEMFICVPGCSREAISNWYDTTKYRYTDYTTKDYSSPDDMNLNGTHCQSKITYESSVSDYPSLYNLTIYYSDIGVEVPPAEPTSCQDGHTTNCTFPNSFSLDKEINLTCLCNISDVSWARNISFVGTGEINVSSTISFYNISPLTAGSIGWISTNGFMNQTH